MLYEVPHNTDNHDRSFDSRVKQKRNAVFYSNATGNTPNLLIAALFLALVLWEYKASEIMLISWLALVAFAALVTVGVEKRVPKRDALNTFPNERWIKQRQFLGGMNALIYGMTPLILPQDVAPAAELYLFIILSTMVTLASIAYSTIPKFILILCMLFLGPLAVYFFIKADYLHIILGATTLIWSIMVHRKTSVVSQTTIKQIVDSEKLQDEIRQHEIVKLQIKGMTNYDLLTGIANRRYMERMINKSINRAKIEGGNVGLIIINLDNFKRINNTFGHQTGNTILKHVASNLRRTLRSTDFIARICGDEFCIVLEDAIDQSMLETVLSRLAEIIRKPIIYLDKELSVEASLGYSQLPEDGDSMDSLMRAADKRMHESKRERKLIPVEAVYR
jgi:diguanylate cyclase (GGDEF)-like protein